VPAPLPTAANVSQLSRPDHRVLSARIPSGTRRASDSTDRTRRTESRRRQRNVIETDAFRGTRRLHTPEKFADHRATGQARRRARVHLGAHRSGAARSCSSPPALYPKSLVCTDDRSEAVPLEPERPGSDRRQSPRAGKHRVGQPRTENVHGELAIEERQLEAGG
jgi:hypothetical protein